MIGGFGIFKRKYAFTVLLQKGQRTWYTGGISICTGIFPLPDVDGIREWAMKQGEGADVAQIICLHRTV